MSQIHKLAQYESLAVYDYHCSGYNPVMKDCYETHHKYNLILPYSGHFYYKLNNDYFRADNSKILLGTKGSTYTIKHEKDVKDKCYCVELSDDILNDLVENLIKENFDVNGILTKKDEFTFLNESISINSNIMNLYNSIIDQKNQIAGELYSKSAVYQLLINILREFELIPQFNKSVKNSAKSHSQELVEEAEKIINNNLHNNISLKFLSEKLYSSPFHFIRVFKEITGKSPYEYTIEKRIELARALLLDTSKSITEISFECGFNNLSNFINTFKKRSKGLSPSSYRKLN